MIHEPRNIKDRVAVGDDIFIIEELDEGRVRLIPDPTHILEVGTPVDKALLQPIEDALGAVTQKLSGIDEGANLIPAGLIAMWSGSVANVPSGWALCNGSNGTPDLRDRFIVGAGGSYDVGNTGGANSVTLNTNQMPSHSHSGSTSSTGSHTHNASPYVNASAYKKFMASNTTSSGVSGLASGTKEWRVFNDPITSMGDIKINMESAGSHSHSVSIQSAGGGQSHENRPPYYALAYIMKL